MNSIRHASWEVPPSTTPKHTILQSELSRTLGRLENRIQKVRESYRLSLIKSGRQVSYLPVKSVGARFFGRKQSSHSLPSSTISTDHKTNSTSNVSDNNALPRYSPERVRNSARLGNEKSPVADFISFHAQYDSDAASDEQTIVDGFIEDLRRVVEICLIGENFVVNLEKRKAEVFRRQQEKWAQARDDIGSSEVDESEINIDNEDGDEMMQLFDMFFEKNGLGMLVNLLNGKIFSFSETEKAEILGESKTTNAYQDNGKEVHGCIVSDKLHCATERVDVDEPDHVCNKTMLPPLSIAIQALQSICILIQNVSRVTSLYVILSNNHVNSLIDFPLILYDIAEQRRCSTTKDEIHTRSEYVNQTIAEMTTHFVTFLKCLAMRINAQTLQFFLRYPLEPKIASSVHLPPATRVRARRLRNRSKSSEGNNLFYEEKFNRVVNRTKSSDGGIENISWKLPAVTSSMPLQKGRNCHLKGAFENTTDPVSVNNCNHRPSPGKGEQNSVEACPDADDYTRMVEFPLYERALEFCSPQHDNFIRLTAMNICLNTLRLTTISENPFRSDSTAQLLAPSPEKVALPAGVLHNSNALPLRERLTIAQFTCAPSRVEKLVSPIFSKLAEHWNAIEEQIRYLNVYKELSINGTSSAAIETRDESTQKMKVVRDFRDKVADLEDELCMLDDVFKVGLVVLNEQTIEIMLATFIYPLVLQPLLIYYKELRSQVDELRFCVTDHPFERISADLNDVDKRLCQVSSPAKTGLVTLNLIFQTLSNRALLRLLSTAILHPLSPDSTSAPTVRGMQEIFSIDLDGRKCIRLDHTDQQESKHVGDKATYDFGRTANGKQSDLKTHVENVEDSCVFVLAPAIAEVLEFTGSPLTRFGPNLYRRAFFGCLCVPDAMTDMRELSSCTFDAIASAFNGKFMSDILFGIDLHDSHAAFNATNPTIHSQRHSEDDERPDLFSEFDDSHLAEFNFYDDCIVALIDSIVSARRVASCDWKLRFDDVAAHALLCIIRQNPTAMSKASHFLQRRLSQAAEIICAQPGGGLVQMGGTNVSIPGAPSVNDPQYEENLFAYFLDYVLFESCDSYGRLVMEEAIMKLRNSVDEQNFYTSISTISDTETLLSRVTSFLDEDVLEKHAKVSSFERVLTCDRRETIIAFIKLDALNLSLRNLCSSNGTILKDTNINGIAFTLEGSVLLTNEATIFKNVLSSLSKPMIITMFDIGDGNNQIPFPGSSVNLASLEMLPCVCEVPASSAHLFCADATSVVAEGVTWQSLYIVFYCEYLVFAQPVQGQMGGMGRVVSACGLARVSVEHDKTSVQQGGPARRLLLSHRSVDIVPPPLFLSDDTKQEHAREASGVICLREHVSTVDIWFEHLKAADHAFNSISSHIFAARVERGIRFQRFFR